MNTPLKITAEEIELVEKLFLIELKNLTEIKIATGFRPHKINRIIAGIMLTKKLHHINKPPDEPIEPGEFERVYKTTYQNSNFVLLTHNEEIKQFRKFLT